MLLTAVLNPLFNHRGLTILCWLPGGNPLTLEAIAYGIAAAGMLAAAISWFYCLNRVFTTDKFVWLFGRIIPFLSLLVSMTLRFVPQFTARARAVAECQRDLRGREETKLLRRARERAAGALHCGHLGAGERHPYRRQHEKPGIRLARPDIFFPVQVYSPR